IDGGGAFEIFHMTTAAAGNGELLHLEGLEIRGGLAPQGGGVYVGRNRALEVVDCHLVGNRSVGEGGAIRAERPIRVQVLRTLVEDNTAGTLGGGLGMNLVAEAEVVDSTFAGNVAETSSGGGISAFSVSSLAVRRSTLSGNSAAEDGGGLSNVVSTVRIESSTVVDNAADMDDLNAGDGGGIAVAGPGAVILLANTLVAGNLDLSTSGDLCPDGFRKLQGAVATEGFNLVGANDCFDPNFPAGAPNTNGDFVGSSASPVDPLLDPLALIGGPTPTHLPGPASPAVDQGSCPGEVADQRGYGHRPAASRVVDDPSIPDFGDGCDIGAVEVGGKDLTGLVFADDFESGDLIRWPSALP
ncbi:MAG: hypothetical protein KDD47_18020, partial [Acidobacteria bacterium]|nr:hypothetical protein [Acidobacteriota bacterium]